MALRAISSKFINLSKIINNKNKVNLTFSVSEGFHASEKILQRMLKIYYTYYISTLPTKKKPTPPLFSYKKQC